MGGWLEMFSTPCGVYILLWVAFLLLYLSSKLKQPLFKFYARREKMEQTPYQKEKEKPRGKLRIIQR